MKLSFFFFFFFFPPFFVFINLLDYMYPKHCKISLPRIIDDNVIDPQIMIML
jgi:hypothetical protein